MRAAGAYRSIGALALSRLVGSLAPIVLVSPPSAENTWRPVCPRGPQSPSRWLPHWRRGLHLGIQVPDVIGRRRRCWRRYQRRRSIFFGWLDRFSSTGSRCWSTGGGGGAAAASASGWYTGNWPGSLGGTSVDPDLDPGCLPSHPQAGDLYIET